VLQPPDTDSVEHSDLRDCIEIDLDIIGCRLERRSDSGSCADRWRQAVEGAGGGGGVPHSDSKRSRSSSTNLSLMVEQKDGRLFISVSRFESLTKLELLVRFRIDPRRDMDGLDMSGIGSDFVERDNTLSCFASLLERNCHN
jgi:hypothetical protein